MSCKVCEYMQALSDEELLIATACVSRAIGERWPGAYIRMPDSASPEEVAAMQAKSISAIPKHLHHLLVNRPQ